MRPSLAALVVLLVCAAPAGAQAPRPSCPGADVSAERAPAAARDAVLCIVNAERAARGLPLVARDGRLETAAQGHSDDMAARGFFAHDTPEGRSVADRADAVGYPYQVLSENIAQGQPTPRRAMTDWMRSTGHCTGVLEPTVAHLGVGLAAAGKAGMTWTQNFGLTRDMPAPSGDYAPAQGCPYDRLSIAPGPATVTLLSLARSGRRVMVAGRVEDEGAGREVVVAARRGGRTARRRILTRADGSFRTTLRAPRGGGRVRVTATATAVPDVYDAGSDTRRI
jgi:uncharacterized protein YkwD